MLGKCTAQRLDNGRFGTDIRFGDQIDGTFFVHRVQSAEMVLEDLATVEGGRRSDLFDTFHVHKKKHLQRIGRFCQPNCRFSV